MNEIIHGILWIILLACIWIYLGAILGLMLAGIFEGDK